MWITAETKDSDCIKIRVYFEETKKSKKIFDRMYSFCYSKNIQKNGKAIRKIVTDGCFFNLHEGGEHR